MKFTLYLHPARIKEWGLTMSEAVIFSFCYELPSWATPISVDGENYYFGDRGKASEETGIELKEDTVYRVYRSLSEKGLIVYKKHKHMDLVLVTDKGRTWNTNSDLNPKNSEKNPKKEPKLGKKSESHIVCYKETSSYKEEEPKSDFSEPLKEGNSGIGVKPQDNRNGADSVINTLSKYKPTSMKAVVKDAFKDKALRLVASKIDINIDLLKTEVVNHLLDSDFVFTGVGGAIKYITSYLKDRKPEEASVESVFPDEVVDVVRKLEERTFGCTFVRKSGFVMKPHDTIRLAKWIQENPKIKHPFYYLDSLIFYMVQLNGSEFSSVNYALGKFLDENREEIERSYKRCLVANKLQP